MTAAQVLVVRATGTRATVTACTRVAAHRYVVSLGPFAARVGRNGVAPAGAKREGDGRTPSGVFPLQSGFGVYGDPGGALLLGPRRQPRRLGRRPALALLQRAGAHAGPRALAQRGAARRLAGLRRRAGDRLNRARVPGLGSAIFLHVDDGSATSGCVSVPRASLLRLLRWEKGAAAVISLRAPERASRARAALLGARPMRVLPRGPSRAATRSGTIAPVRISAKIDYAVRAGAELAAGDPEAWVTADTIGTAQGIPTAFLLNILARLRAAGIVESRRGVHGGYRLARPAASISVADVIRAIDGPLANVAGSLVEDVSYQGAAASLRDTWVALRVTMRGVLEEVTLAGLAAGELPPHVRRLLKDEQSWVTRAEGLG